jgi:hypothetical protein
MKILTNLAFWSAISGFAGTILMYFYGLPDPIHSDGSIYLALEQIDENQIHKAVVYKWHSNIGLSLVALSFLLQFLDSLKKFGNEMVPETLPLPPEKESTEKHDQAEKSGFVS